MSEFATKSPISTKKGKQQGKKQLKENPEPSSLINALAQSDLLSFCRYLLLQQNGSAFPLSSSERDRFINIKQCDSCCRIYEYSELRNCKKEPCSCEGIKFSTCLICGNECNKCSAEHKREFATYTMTSNEEKIIFTSLVCNGCFGGITGKIDSKESTDNAKKFESLKKIIFSKLSSSDEEFYGKYYFTSFMDSKIRWIIDLIVSKLVNIFNGKDLATCLGKNKNGKNCNNIVLIDFYSQSLLSIVCSPVFASTPLFVGNCNKCEVEV